MHSTSVTSVMSFVIISEVYLVILGLLHVKGFVPYISSAQPELRNTTHYTGDFIVKGFITCESEFPCIKVL